MRRNDVPCEAREKRYTTARTDVFAGQAPGEGLDGSRARQSALCAFPRGRIEQTAKLQNTHMSKDTRRVATPSHTALAACLLTGAGAAETGARRRQPPFDPIRDLTPGREVGRHGHGRRGDAHRPCSQRSGANPHRGAFGTRTALPGLGRWADEVAEMRQGHEGKPGLLGTTRECVGLWIA
jgi:hypothetical protein